MHDSMASYRRTLSPEGNPQGERYHEVGNEPLKPYKAPEFSEEQRVNDIKRALDDVKNDRVPPLHVVGESF